MIRARPALARAAVVTALAAAPACGGGGSSGGGSPGARAPGAGPEVATAHGGGHDGAAHAGGGHDNAATAHGGHDTAHAGGGDDTAHAGGGHDDAAHAGHHSGGMPHRFENADEWARSLEDPARDARQQPDRVLGALGLTPAMVVADIGAGTGYFAVRLARAVPRGQVIATDVEPDMIRYMTERARREGLPNLRAVQTPSDSPELAAASVDRVLVVDVWHHLGDRAAYARKLAAALRPGGQLAVVDFKLDAKHGPPPQHRLTPESIVADLRAAGLAAEVSAVDLPEQYIIIGRR